MVRPRNQTTGAEAEAAFAAAKNLGWETLACSPFCRGWELDKWVQKAVAREPAAAEPQVRAWPT